MNSTSISLIERLRKSDDDAAWKQFVFLYAPLIFHWGLRQGLKPEDASDLVQEVLTLLVTKLPEFKYDPSRRFRGWLRTLTVNKARDFRRRWQARPATRLDETIDYAAPATGADLFDEVEYRAYLVRRGRALIESEFTPHTWQACWKYVAEGRSATSVGEELGISANAVRVAKCRVLRRLREELAGLMD